MTEWVTLLLLIPAIVVPVVLAFGFAGCDLIFPLNEYPSFPPGTRPTNLEAKATGRSTIALSWDFEELDPVRFEVSQLRAGESDFHLVTPADYTEATFLDSGLDEGTAYSYQVVAVQRSGGDRSELAETTTSTLGKAFEALSLVGEEARPGRCIVQRIEPIRLARSGSRVQITLQRPSTGDLVINRVSLSHAAAAGVGDPYDSVQPPTMVVDLNAPVAVPVDPAGGPFELPAVDFVLDQTQPLLVAFDIGAPGNVRFLPGVPAGESEAFVSGPNVQEAQVPDRTTGYNDQNRIYLVQRIDVS